MEDQVRLSRPCFINEKEIRVKMTDSSELTADNLSGLVSIKELGRDWVLKPDSRSSASVFRIIAELIYLLCSVSSGSTLFSPPIKTS